MRVSQLVRVVAGPCAAVAVVYFAISACGGSSSPSAPPPPPRLRGPDVPPPSVTITAAIAEDVPVVVEAIVTVTAGHLMNVVAPRAGTVTGLLALTGAHLTRGQPVIAMEDARGRPMSAVSPIEGTLVDVSAHLHDRVGPNSALGSIGDMTHMHGTAYVPATADLRVDQSVTIIPRGSTHEAPATVRHVSPPPRPGDPALVELDVDNAGGELTHFGEATLHIQTGVHTGAVTVPAAAVVMRGGVQAVMVAQGGYAHLREVAVGAHVEDRSEIVGGLRAGEDVVLSPGSLADGAQVIPR